MSARSSLSLWKYVVVLRPSMISLLTPPRPPHMMAVMHLSNGPVGGKNVGSTSVATHRSEGSAAGAQAAAAEPCTGVGKWRNPAQRTHVVCLPPELAQHLGWLGSRVISAATSNVTGRGLCRGRRDTGDSVDATRGGDGMRRSGGRALALCKARRRNTNRHQR